MEDQNQGEENVARVARDVTRRQFLSRTAPAMAAIVLAPAFLGACSSGKGTPSSGKGTSSGSAAPSSATPSSATPSSAAPSSAAAGSAAAGSAAAGGAAGSLKKSIGFDFPENSLPVYANLVKFAREESASTGYKLLLDGDNGAQDKEIANVQTWINQGIGGIVVFPLEPTTMESMAAAAMKKGIVWVVYGGKMTNQSGSIEFSPYQSGVTLGTNAAEWANKNLGGKGKAAFLINETIDLTRQRDKGVQDTFPKLAPGVQIVSKQFANSEQTGLQAMSAILTAHPDINIVLAVNDDGAVGAYQAFLNKGTAINDPKVYIGGQDGTQQALENIKKNTIFRATCVVRLKDLGHAVVDLPKQILEGGKGGAFNVPVELATIDSPDLDAFIADYA